MTSKIYYQTYGEGTPIYFLHGNHLDSTSMVNWYESYFSESNSYKRIYLDIPGMGKSPINDDIKNSDDVLTEIADFIQETSINQDFLLCGHSYGGYLALGLSQIFKNKIIAMFITCPVVKARQKDRLLVENKNILEQEVIPTTNQEYYEDYLGINTRINEKTWTQYQKSILPGVIKSLPFWENLSDRNYQFSFEKSLKPISEGKSIVLLGKFDNVVGYKNQETFFEHADNFETILLKTSGHNLPIDDKDSLKKYFLEFIQ
ncbi:alpha/beta hydrolase [Lactobacillus sp. YT155]|uniref:alpha/beta fold hydrolase n=1 Tax=Lactobacillus sp. YT155 TaxID=3060955 RepID=UPI00265FA630|nr:alpha/beta hydrolase [Lactobacillus sp. YT155]MDO1605046.1 alpha/beta hydrolase [Lactobacillus sp. YT155]